MKYNEIYLTEDNMTKTLVLHHSIYGTTKKYAEWIASELNGDCRALAEVKENTLTQYDAIIIGSSLYAGKIKGMDIIVRNFQALRGKKLVLFTCGLADYSKPENINAIAGRIEAAIPENIRQEMKLFFLRGGIDYRKLSFMHRMMMAVMNIITVKKLKKDGAGANEEDKEFVASYGKSLDFTDRNSIKGIIDYLRPL